MTSQVIEDPDQIDVTLQIVTVKKQPICYFERDGTQITLEYTDDGKLWLVSPPVGRGAYKPLVDVKFITYDFELESWIVVWKV